MLRTTTFWEMQLIYVSIRTQTVIGSFNIVFIFKENLHHGCLNLQIMPYKGVENVKTGSDSQHKSKSLAFLFNL